MKDQPIDKEAFDLWMINPVTKALMSALRNIRDGLNQALTHGNVIMEEDAPRKLARFLGQRDGVDLVLNIRFEDVEDKEEE